MLTLHKPKPRITFAGPRCALNIVIMGFHKPLFQKCRQVTALDSEEKLSMSCVLVSGSGRNADMKSQFRIRSGGREIGRLISEQMRPVRATHFSN